MIEQTGQEMDPADPVRSIINKQGVVLGRHEQALQSLEAQYRAIGQTQQGILDKLDQLVQSHSGSETACAQPTRAHTCR